MATATFDESTDGLMVLLTDDPNPVIKGEDWICINDNLYLLLKKGDLIGYLVYRVKEIVQEIRESKPIYEQFYIGLVPVINKLIKTGPNPYLMPNEEKLKALFETSYLKYYISNLEDFISESFIRS